MVNVSVHVCAFCMINTWNTHNRTRTNTECHIWVPRSPLHFDFNTHNSAIPDIPIPNRFFSTCWGSIMISQLMDHEKSYKPFSLKFALKLDACSQRECHTLGIVYKTSSFFPTIFFENFLDKKKIKSSFSLPCERVLSCVCVCVLY